MSESILLEIGTEEMPAKAMPGVVSELKRLAEEKLKEARIVFDSVQVYATPRRMAFVVSGAAEKQIDEEVKKRGPSIQAAFDENGAPTRAAQGFARGQHVEPADLVREGDYVWAETVNRGLPTKEVLPQFFHDVIMALSFPKSMRWGDEEMRFIRPIRWLVALYGKDVVPFTVAGVQSGRMSRGHRFLSSGEVEIAQPEEYKTVMREAFVIVDQDERRALIQKGLEETASSVKGHVTQDADLLEEINYLVEYPTPLCGRIDEEFLQLPEPAVVTPMRDHQRYYPVRDDAGKLMPLFLTVRNGGDKALHNVQIGNERVLRARLDDAKFFFQEDRKKTLEERREDLKRINYQESMGTMLDKADRLRNLVQSIGADWELTAEEAEAADRAAYLSKSDLATGMVTEFTELEGEMGKEYALLDGEKPEVAQAIFEQYMPRFAGDILPQESIGRALSIADKLDNVAATFLRGLIPTGSQDPFALRRQTIGAVNILVDGQIHWDIRRGFAQVLALLPGEETVKAACAEKMEDFFRQRIRAILLDKGISYDIIDAVTEGPVDDVYALFLRAQAMKDSGLKKEEALRQAMTRLANITKGQTAVSVLPSLLEEGAEKDLWQALVKAGPAVIAACDTYRYEESLPALKTLTDPVNAFLDTVMVMVEDEKVRMNRLSLLIKVLELTKRWGDFSKLV